MALPALKPALSSMASVLAHTGRLGSQSLKLKQSVAQQVCSGRPRRAGSVPSPLPHRREMLQPPAQQASPHAARRRVFTTAVCRRLPWPLQGVRLIDHFSREVVDDIFACALKKQTGVSLKYMSVRRGGASRITKGCCAGGW